VEQDGAARRDREGGVKTKRRLAGTHYLLRHGYNYLVESDVSGRAYWGDRRDAVRFDEWNAREARRVLRKGRGLMRRPMKGVTVVRVTVWLRRPS
jgi:hypothetical protein